MKLYIPDIGDILKLESDWTFELYNESRNVTLFDAFNIEYIQRWYNLSEMPHHSVTLPKGTELKVDRVYIRKNASEYSSLSFFIHKHEDKYFKGKRFWAKLNDVNNMDIIKADKPHTPIIKVETFVDGQLIKQDFSIGHSIVSYNTNTPEIFKIDIDSENVILKYEISVDGQLKYQTLFTDVEIEKRETKYGTWPMHKMTYTSYILKKCKAVTINVETKEVISKAITLNSIKQKIRKLETS